jgi:hypothetical protein
MYVHCQVDVQDKITGGKKLVLINTNTDISSQANLHIAVKHSYELYRSSTQDLNLLKINPTGFQLERSMPSIESEPRRREHQLLNRVPVEFSQYKFCLRIFCFHN